MTSEVALPKEKVHRTVKWRQLLERDSSIGYAMVTPAALILMLFIAYPFISSASA